MHYSPFPAGFGLLAIGHFSFGSSPIETAARILLDLAGAGFLLLGLFFISMMIYGSIAGPQHVKDLPSSVKFSRDLKHLRGEPNSSVRI